jgi:hydroxymethylpyrimidine pyrophosphatase-like HAD family hydrolase
VLDSYVEKYSQILGEEIIVNSGGAGLIEFINSKYNKGFAVEILSREFNIPFEKIIAVGDSTNDLPLMDKRWHSVAVGDGSNELKNRAKEITVPFSENPVKILLEKYCLKD